MKRTELKRHTPLRSTRRDPRRREADRLVSMVVRNRDGWTCQKCSATRHTTTIDWAHIEARNTAPWLRYDPDNAIALCRRCHTRFGESPRDWRIFIARRYPGRREELQRRALEGERAGRTLDVDAVIAWARRELEGAA
jgi:5-methylcytosine-specific restriction endonuclease McrA